MQTSKSYFILCLMAFSLAYCVVVLGAYVRLSDAGLGCPDWPGCYGKLIVPDTKEDLHASYANQTVHQGKAWKEMTHRYAAGILGLLIFVMIILAWKQARQRTLTSILAGLVIFQAALGMWTVTWLLKPAVVSAHLLGGFAVLSLLFWLLLRQLPHMQLSNKFDRKFMPWVVAGLAVLILQIFLGGWTSANYAALICPEFPVCRGGEWLPATNFSEGFTFWRGLGINYEGGVLDAPARTAIHISHRVGAVITFLVLFAVALRGLGSSVNKMKKIAAGLLILLLLQVSLGIINIIKMLPLAIAVAHNGVAALLLLALLGLLYLSLQKRTDQINHA